MLTINFLKQFYPFKNGIPLHNTFARVFTLIDSKQFSKMLEVWTRSLRINMEKIKHISVDGETLRGSLID